MLPCHDIFYDVSSFHYLLLYLFVNKLILWRLIILLFLLIYLTGTVHSYLAAPELAISWFSSVVPGQETENNFSAKRHYYIKKKHSCKWEHDTTVSATTTARQHNNNKITTWRYNKISLC